MSERMACRLVGLSRSAYRRPLKGDTVADPDRALRDWLRVWAKNHPETSRPGQAPRRRLAPDQDTAGERADGVPSGRAEQVRVPSPAQGRHDRRPGQGVAGLAARVREEASAVGIPQGLPRRSRRGVGREPQEDPAALARGRPPCPPAAAAQTRRILDRRRPGSGRTESRVGGGLPVRCRRAGPPDQDLLHRRRTHP